MSRGETLRCFVAVLLGEEARAALCGASAELCGEERAFRRIGSENLHVTLQFLGELTPARVEAVRTALSRALAGTQAFELELQGSGAFPSARRPRVVWVGVGRGAEPLRRLANTVSLSLEPLGLRPDKPFSPHITVARARGTAPALRTSLASGRIVASVAVEAVDLMQSELSSQGARYRSLLRVALSPAGRT